jgi:SAM-dependent methyltransferase
MRVPLHTEGRPPTPILGHRSDPAQAIWDEKHENEIGSSWTNNPLVVSAIELRQTGQVGRFWLGWLFEEQLKEPVERVLSIGCGAGGHEIMIAHEGWANQIDAFDASSGGIERARSHAAELSLNNIDFRVSTFEEFAENGPDAPIYDVVLFAGSLHHVRDLEGMLSRVRRCLKANGRVLFNEYVGPLYAIYPPQRVAILNRVLRSIPAEYKREPDIQWVNPTIDDVMRQDPSEGVRSAILLDVLEMYFDFELKIDFGGGLLHPIFDLLDTKRLADGSVDSEAVVSMLVETEDLLTEYGVIDSDMSFGICRHKS